MKYYGQKGLDKYIHKNFISRPFANGTFLEIGALDGIEYSNTKFFEDNMGFNKGILIEPVPNKFRQLIKNRPNCELFNVAVHSVLTEVVFLQSECFAVSCIEDVATREFKNTWHKNSKKLTLPATTMASIIKQSSLKYIDFFSLDVEGAEFECLKSMNWNIPVGLMCIEMNRDIDEIESVLHQNNFIKIGQHEQNWGVINYIYFNKKYFRKELFTGVLQTNE